MRKPNTKRTLVMAAVIFGGLLVVSTQAQQAPSLLRPTTREGSVKQEPDPTVIRSQNVIVDIQRLRVEQKALTLQLFDGKSLTVIRTGQQETKRGLVWIGNIAGQPFSSVTLSVIGDVLIGNVMTQRGEVYQIRYLGNRIHSLRQIDQSKFPREAQPLKPDLKTGGGAAADTCSTDPPTDIDVMVVYTDDARSAAGGTDAMDAAVYLAVAETNQSYFNSNITQRLRLVHVLEVNYAESGNINTDLTQLQNGSIGNVPTLRNTFAADAVVMITNNGGGYCGLGYMMQTVSNAFESVAYSVVARSCATGYFSFGHELGHNMGADHDCANANSTGPYPYNRGYSDTSPTSPATPWRTIMSYPTSPASTRVQYWSNPGVNYPIGGDPMGGPCGSSTTNNHQVLNNTALTVANFRCSSPSAGNVWMKDTWNDTGAEPDSHTASEDMWKSPYIWVRNTQDTNLTHQHQHENPIIGTTNWVYVKLHNGFNTTTSGNLELWYANASVNLSWSSAWTQLPSIPVSGFAPHSTKVVEAQWTNLPGTGHYCMVARWNSSSDPMTHAETTDINGNTRNNNNIVWRNLNIVTPDPSEDVSFIVRGIGGRRTITSLVIRAPKNETANSFSRHGRITIWLDESLMKAWRQGGSKGRGYKTDGRSFRITDPAGAVFENIITDPELVGRVRMEFRKLPTTPQRTFIIDAIQMNMQGQLGLAPGRYLPVIGGVSYEIHTERR